MGPSVHEIERPSPGNDPSLPISAEHISAGASEAGSPFPDLVSIPQNLPAPYSRRSEAEELGQRRESVARRTAVIIPQVILNKARCFHCRFSVHMPREDKNEDENRSKARATTRPRRNKLMGEGDSYICSQI